ncbi:Amiloride-sensitive sodium channel subunit alpha [Lamellibrachia satsuma]|nr:Amiloride-sensitive sodium channel subunit alpha [Lamellibrachia satsuma]
MVEDNAKNAPADLWQLLRESTAKTGVQGVSNISEARSRARKTFWAFVVVAGVVLLVWQVSVATIQYFSYPVNTRTLQHSAQAFHFPAVTFCNLNPLRASAVRDGKSRVGQVFSSFANVNASNATGPEADLPKPTTFPSVEDEWDDDGILDGSTDDLNYTTETTEFQTQERFGRLFSRLSRKQRQKAGHQMSAMLLRCSWNGRPCNAMNFTHFNNYLYGNCFTFNGVSNNMNLTTTRTGPLYGLSMRLFVEQFEYVESLSDAAGVILVVHNQTSMPFPEDDGISISPGTKTFIGLIRHTTTRIGQPYGNCADYTTKENLDRNAYVRKVPTVEYSLQACTKTCFQRHLMTRCGCYSERYPFACNITAYASVDVSRLLHCDDASQTRSDRAYPQHSETFPHLGCLYTFLFLLHECPRLTAILINAPNYEVAYRYSISQSTWPSVVKQPAVLEGLYTQSPYLWDTIKRLNEREKSVFLSNNVLDVEVYFESFNYEEVRTEPSYTVSDLLADIGGQGGLWLGVSVVACCELIELLIDFIVLTLGRLASTKKLSSRAIPLQP